MLAELNQTLGFAAESSLTSRRSLSMLFAAPEELPAVNQLQQWAQAMGAKTLPTYKHIASVGPHHKPLFVQAVCGRSGVVCVGCGRSKKLAKAAAAQRLLEHLQRHVVHSAVARGAFTGVPGASFMGGATQIEALGVTELPAIVSDEPASLQLLWLSGSSDEYADAVARVDWARRLGAAGGARYVQHVVGATVVRASELLEVSPPCNALACTVDVPRGLRAVVASDYTSPAITQSLASFLGVLHARSRDVVVGQHAARDCHEPRLMSELQFLGSGDGDTLVRSCLSNLQQLLPRQRRSPRVFGLALGEWPCAGVGVDDGDGVAPQVSLSSPFALHHHWFAFDVATVITQAQLATAATLSAEDVRAGPLVTDICRAYVTSFPAGVDWATAESPHLMLFRYHCLCLEYLRLHKRVRLSSTPSPMRACAPTPRASAGVGVGAGAAGAGAGAGAGEAGDTQLARIATTAIIVSIVRAQPGKRMLLSAMGATLRERKLHLPGSTKLKKFLVQCVEETRSNAVRLQLCHDDAASVELVGTEVEGRTDGGAAPPPPPPPVRSLASLAGHAHDRQPELDASPPSLCEWLCARPTRPVDVVEASRAAQKRVATLLVKLGIVRFMVGSSR